MASGHVPDRNIPSIVHCTTTIRSRLKLGAGGRAILCFSETYPTVINFFDRYLTSRDLLGKLMHRGISSTGTIMTNEFPNAGINSDGDK